MQIDSSQNRACCTHRENPRKMVYPSPTSITVHSQENRQGGPKSCREKVDLLEGKDDGSRCNHTDEDREGHMSSRYRQEQGMIAPQG